MLKILVILIVVLGGLLGTFSRSMQIILTGDIEEPITMQREKPSKEDLHELDPAHVNLETILPLSQLKELAVQNNKETKIAEARMRIARTAYKDEFLKWLGRVGIIIAGTGTYISAIPLVFAFPSQDEVKVAELQFERSKEKVLMELESLYYEVLGKGKEFSKLTIRWKRKKIALEETREKTKLELKDVSLDDLYQAEEGLAAEEEALIKAIGEFKGYWAKLVSLVGVSEEEILKKGEGQER